MNRAGAATRGRAGRAAPTAGCLPSKRSWIFLRTAGAKVGKREIAKAFHLKSDDRIALKGLLAEMTEEGLLSGNRKGFKEKGGLPPVAVLEITGRDADGDLMAEPTVWDTSEGPRPRVIIPAAGTTRIEASLAQGDRVLSRISRIDGVGPHGIALQGDPIKKLPREKRRLIGIFRAREKGGGVIDPVDRKEMRTWTVQAGDEGNAKDGDLVRFDLARAGRFANPMARVVEALGNPTDQRQISLIAVHAHGIPDEFPERVLDEVEKLSPPKLQGRTDLRSLELLTIDPIDARDHDDAVHAARDEDPANEGGFVVHVAIADVAHYVRPGTRLDHEAQIRGNSVYFPDRVVPMLPERISNDLCSLREKEDRPCLVARMVFDKTGAKRSHTFLRAMMRSAAKLSYEEAQAAINGKPSPKAEPLLESALKPLWAAYAALAAARDRREPLNLDLPERRVKLDDKGHIERIYVPERLEAHRLIEEFMIQANVAAAETLEQKKSPVIYRVHEAPSREKLTALREFLESLDMKIPGQGALKSGLQPRAGARCQMPVADLVNEVVLRSQSQAVYATENLGHFGLNLRRYARLHLAHPALCRSCRAPFARACAGPGRRAHSAMRRARAFRRSLSRSRRPSAAPCRPSGKRWIGSSPPSSQSASAPSSMPRVSGVTRAGLFVRLRETGADGFIPASTIGDDYFRHHEDQHALIGDRTARVSGWAMNVRVKLVEAVPTAGALRFEMLSEGRRDAAGRTRLPKGRRLGDSGGPSFRPGRRR